MQTVKGYRFAAFGVLALLGTAIGGCGDDSSCERETCSTSGGGGAGTGAGTTTGGTGGAGGGQGDPPTVRLVDRYGTLGAGYDVLVYDQAGTLVAHEQADDSGEIFTPVPAGASVYVLYSDTYIRDAVARTRRVVRSVQLDGDAPVPLVLQYELYPTEVEATGAVDLTVTYPALAGATKYVFRSTCKNDPMFVTATSVTYQDVPICTADGTYDILVLGYDANNQVVDIASLKDQTFVDGMTHEHDLTWSGVPFPDVTLSTTNIPAGALSTYFSASAGERGSLDPWLDFSTTVQTPMTDESATLQNPVGFGSFHGFNRSVLLESTAEGFANTQIWELAPQNGGPPAWNAMRLDRLTAAVESDPIRLGWTFQGDGELGDLVSTEISWGDGDEGTQWFGLFPPTATEAVFPELPAELAEYAPQPGAISAGASNTDLTGIDGYAQILAQGDLTDGGERQNVYVSLEP